MLIDIWTLLRINRSSYIIAMEAKCEKLVAWSIDNILRISNFAKRLAKSAAHALLELWPDVVDDAGVERGVGEVVFHESGQLCEHLIKFCGADARVHPPHAIRSHLSKVQLKSRNERVIAVVLLGDIVHQLVVLEPKAHIPRGVVFPAIECWAIVDHALKFVHESSILHPGGPWGL